jgi:hypothetical protein
MSCGLLISRGAWLGEKVMLWVPEPRDGRFYLWLAVFLGVFGLVPYFLFTAEPWYEAIRLDLMGGRGGGATWLVGRTGNVNTSWGGYIVQFFQCGAVGGLLGIFYCVMVGRNWLGRLIGLAVWIFWTLQGVGTGTRGFTAFMMVPAMGFLFIRYQGQAALKNKFGSIGAYLWVIGLGLVVLVILHLQITYRNKGFNEISMDDVTVGNLEGNSMFSEGLNGWALIPGEHGFFRDQFPGSTLLLPVPETGFWFVMGWIPRALWPDKPIDPIGPWYNTIVVGGEGLEGTTVAKGLVGFWYFKYGLFGVIEGALLIGWILRACERCLQRAADRPMALLTALFISTWVFRCFRDFAFADLYPALIGLIAFAMLVWVLKPLFGGTVAGAAREYAEAVAAAGGRDG